jgi:hypothetical protein
MKTFNEWLEENNLILEGKKKEKWIAKAVKHPGRCKHPGDEKCPKGSPQYNLAMRFKKGDIHQANLEKDEKDDK